MKECICKSDNIEIMGWDIPIDLNKKSPKRNCSSPCSIMDPIHNTNQKTKTNKKKKQKSKRESINIKEISLNIKLIHTDTNYRNKIYKLAVQLAKNFIQIYICVLMYNYYTMRYNQVYRYILCQNETIYNQDKLLEFIGDYTIDHTRDLVDEYNEHVFNIIKKELDNNLDDLNDINVIVNNEIDLNNNIETKLTPIENIIVDRNETLTTISKNRIFCKDNPKYNERLKMKLRDPISMKMMISILYDLVHS